MITPRTLSRQLRTAPLPRVPALPRWARRLEPLHLVWLAIWAPWWVGNELPPPASPRSRQMDMTEQPEGSPGAWLLDSLDDLRFRFGISWAAALLVRGAWLGGVADIAWIFVAMFAGTPSPTLTQLGILIGVGAALGLALRTFHRPSYAVIALLLERAFLLRSRISTAILALRFGGDAPGELHALQLADAANTLDRARGQLRPIHWVPVREIFIAFIVALTLLLLLVARRPEGEIPPASSASLPDFVPVSERLAVQEQPQPAEVPDAATLEEVEDLSRTSNQARQDLDAIRDALDDTQQTMPAADAIAGEDYPTANERLSEASEAVTQLPESARKTLADQLDEAANRVSDDNAELADAARRASDDIRSGDDAGAIDELGDRIEETGEDVIPQEASGNDLSASPGESQESSAGSSQPGSAEQPEPSDQGSGGEPGQSGDPGAGMEASGGTGESGESGQPSGEGSEGGDRSADAGDSASTGEQAEQDGDSGEGSSSSSGDQPGEDAGDRPGSSSKSSESESGEQGGGAAGGDRQGDESGEANAGDGGSEANPDEQAPESGEGEAGDPPPGGEGGDEGEGSQAASGGSAIQLPGTSGERVSSGSDVGASSVGSGGGVGAGSGDSTSGVSGSSGPDPNTVPAEWRALVERYFREGGAP